MSNHDDEYLTHDDYACSHGRNTDNILRSNVEIEISPKCGPESGFNFEIIAGGFKPDTNVNWQLVDSDENVPLSGYFETDGEGQIRETTFADDLEEGHYIMYVGEDVENDGKVDTSIIPAHVELNIPCSDKD